MQAVREVSLAIRRGEFTAIVGPSGSGKTTLLNLMGALDRPDAGEIWLDGIPLHRLSERERAEVRKKKVGFIFQSFNLIPVWTAEENAVLYLEFVGYPRAEIQRRVETIFRRLGLWEKRHRRPNALSGGEQQRVAVARALLKEPTVILADEPTANLDSRTARELLQLMREMRDETGITFVFSTHDPQVMQFAERVIRLVDGRITA